MTSWSLRALMVLGAAAGAVTPAAGADATDASRPGLADSHWTLRQLGADTGDAQGALSLGFEGGTRVSGHDGCNAFAGAVTMTADTLAVDDQLAGTLAACPQAVEMRARAFRDALLRARRYSVSADTLQLMDAAGAVLATFAPAPASLAGTAWQAIAYNNGKEAVITLIPGTRITARFGKDGRVTGNAGCNNYFATYSVAGRVLAVGPPGATRRACDDPEGVMIQEARFLQLLPEAVQYRATGTRLELRNANGSMLATFEREGE